MIDILCQIWPTPYRKLQYRKASEDLEFTQESYELLLWHGFIAGMVIVLSYRHFMEKSFVNIL